MQISALRKKIDSALLDFAWSEWAQMGVLATPERESPWAADPEAHLVFTLQVARSDPRMFDETLDWLAANFTLISAQRLRNMCASDEDARLVEAALAWVAAHGQRPHAAPPRSTGDRPRAEPLFYGRRKPTRTDESFARFGFLRPPAARTRKSRRPDVKLPINFAFRLRDIFGVGSRAEILRFLLTASSHTVSGRPQFTTLAIADAAGFAKRNVQEALNALVEAGAIETAVRGRLHLHSIRPEAWRDAFGLDGLPQFRDWTHALLGLRELHRWLWRTELDDLTPYMRASEARLLMGQIESSFRHAGMSLRERGPAEGEEYWPVFADLVEQVLAQLTSELPW